VAPTDSTVMLNGESGTGKELFARAIHAHSHRAVRQFVAVDCSTFSSSLMESELFGHVKGAFTGAVKDKAGIFDIANHGSLFLDEVANLNLDIQAKLLRVMETREFKPVGADQFKKTNVRIIAATNCDLKMRVDEGNFREDLFYRLNVFPIFIPPLRERRDDIARLLYHFLKHYCRQTGKRIDGFSDDALEILVNHNWPGNVRQLKNVVERLVILSDDRVLNYQDVCDHWENNRNPKPEVIPETLADLKAVKRHLLENKFGKIEKAFLQKAFSAAEGNIALAARQVGMQRSNFSALMKKHGLSANSFHTTLKEDNRMR
jgi:two-component system NtrC family response regulator